MSSIVEEWLPSILRPRDRKVRMSQRMQIVAAADEDREVDPAILQIAEFCQGILDIGGSPKSQEAVLRRARVALPPSAFLLLRYLALVGPLTVSQLAEIVDLHSTTVSSQLRPLTDKKLVRRTVDADDRRVVSLSITATGRNVCQRVLLAGARGWTKVFADWSKEDLEQLGSLLKRARADTFATMEAKQAAKAAESE
jgi:DNA-binding MarR family transcriptional regulator